MQDQHNLTQLLVDWRAGSEAALGQLMPLIHKNLHQMANRYMQGENAGHTLQATALVNEAFIKLVNADVTWQNRAHYMALSARAMRQILVDHARANRSEKRGGNAVSVTLHETRIEDQGHQNPDVLEVEEAIEQLSQLDPRKAQVIELSFYGGLTYEEIAEALEISPATVDRELRFAKAWMYRQLSETQ